MLESKQNQIRDKIWLLALAEGAHAERKKAIRRKYKTNMTKIEVATVETQMMYGFGSPWTSSDRKLDIFLSRQYVARGETLILVLF